VNEQGHGHRQAHSSATDTPNASSPDLGRTTVVELFRTEVNLSACGHEIAGALSTREPGRNIDFRIAEGLLVGADERLVRVLLENLPSNAVKYTRRNTSATVELGQTVHDGSPMCFVRDNGVGFDPERAGHLFRPFNRLHGGDEFPRTGVGLATCKRIVRRHGGRIVAESKPGEGATFYFTLSHAAGERPRVEG